MPAVGPVGADGLATSCTGDRALLNTDALVYALQVIGSVQIENPFLTSR